MGWGQSSGDRSPCVLKGGLASRIYFQDMPLPPLFACKVAAVYDSFGGALKQNVNDFMVFVENDEKTMRTHHSVHHSLESYS